MLDDFGDKLIHWYERNKRNLPWRDCADPYKIWLSEIILQQTRVEQGMDYYLKFIRRFPDIFSLAKASQQEIYKMWQGLGYYNRANNLMAAAQTIVDDFGGSFPQQPRELMKIKGIGPYTAAAVASIAFDVAVPVVDGNVFRVLARIFGIATPIQTGRGKKEFETLAATLLQNHPPGTFNQAMMEFGALFCQPKNPDCQQCIFLDTCQAAKNGTVEQFPVKQPKAAVRNRFFYYLFIEFAQNGGPRAFVLKKRNQKDIWRNLYDFPLVEYGKRKQPEEILHMPEFNDLIGQTTFTVSSVSREYCHQLTHQKIHAVFIHLIVDKKPAGFAENALILVDEKKIDNYPVPRLLDRYLQDQENLI